MEETTIVPIEEAEKHFSFFDSLKAQGTPTEDMIQELLVKSEYNAREACCVYVLWTQYRDAHLHLAKSTNLFD